ncbi:hypothetical protein E6H21_04725 [Candidatus Bathyarchaeota archaeon]|nr:MAG: hypothetical protein E6H21_04725 [Candidatus Bathyarchaeota archaeon]
MTMEVENTQHRLALFLVLFVSLTAIFSSVTFYAMSAKPSQSFIGFGLYSQRGLQGYITNSNLTVPTGQTQNWTFAVTNRMNKAEFVMIIARIGNSSTPTPNATTPSTTLPELGRTDRFINDGETSRINFTWTIESSYQTGQLTYLNITFNAQPAVSSTPVGTMSGANFRLIFELWTFDPASGSFQYGYPGQTSQVGNWLQVWFSAS